MRHSLIGKQIYWQMANCGQMKILVIQVYQFTKRHSKVLCL